MIHIQEEEGEEGDRGSRRKRLCLEWQVCALVARLLVGWCFGCGVLADCTLVGRWMWCCIGGGALDIIWYEMNLGLV